MAGEELTVERQNEQTCAMTWIVPVFNEEARLGSTMAEILRAAEAQNGCEVLFVDDGSTDRTRARLCELIAGHPCARIAGYTANRGKGGAIAEGMRTARGDIVFFFDIDLSTPLDRVTRADAFKSYRRQDRRGLRRGGGRAGAWARVRWMIRST